MLIEIIRIACAWASHDRAETAVPTAIHRPPDQKRRSDVFETRDDPSLFK